MNLVFKQRTLKIFAFVLSYFVVAHLYAKVSIKDALASPDSFYIFYILDNDRILLEGDVHRYYLAVKE